MIKATVGVDCLNKNLPRHDLVSSSTSIDGQAKNEDIQMQIWDTTGQENYRSLNRIYYRGSQGVGFVFDLTNKESFDGLESWVQEYL